MRTLYYLAMLVGICVVATVGGLLVHGSAPAQDSRVPGHEPVCQTQPQITANAAKHNVKVFAEFDNVTFSTGLHTEHLVVFELAPGRYVLMGFDKGCMAGFQEIDQDALEQVLDEAMGRKAGGA